MTRDDAIRLAREAGVISSSPFFGVWENHALQLERFAQLVIADFLKSTGQYVTNDASRKAAITEAVAPWKSAVIDQLVIAHILTAEHESDPLKAIQDLLAYHSDIAVDPRVSGAAAKLVEQAKAEEREACTSPATRSQSIDALVGDRLTAKKADHICERDGYAVTGVVLTLPDGRACIVNRSAVRWLHGDDMFNLMHTDTAMNQRLFDDAVQTEREACAAVRLPVTAFDFRQKILKGELNAKYDEGFLDGVRALRAAIRARGQK